MKQFIACLLFCVASCFAATEETGVTRLNVKPSNGATGEVRWFELISNGTNYVGFKAPTNLTLTQIWQLPSADGTSNQVLKTNGSGVLSWYTIPASNDASALTTGTVADARLSSNVTLQGNTFNLASMLVQLDSMLRLPAVNGSQLTALNATNISSGTLDDLRLSTNVTLAGNTFNGASQLVQLDGSGLLPALDGSQLTGIVSNDASALTIGTLDDARLSTNVTLAGNTFNGASQLLQLDGGGALPALDGNAITNLNAANVAGANALSDGVLSTNVTLQGNTFNGASQLVQLDGSGLLPALDGSQLINLPALSGDQNGNNSWYSSNAFWGITTLDNPYLIDSINFVHGANVPDGQLNASGGDFFFNNVGTADGRLRADGSALTGIDMGNLVATGTGQQGGVVFRNIANQLQNTLALTNYGLMVGGGAAGPSALTDLGTTGKVLQGNASGNPTWVSTLPAMSGANLTTLNASNLSSGTVGTARLGSGSATSSTYLRGDQTWAAVAGGDTTVMRTTDGSSLTSSTFADDGVLQFAVSANKNYRFKTILYTDQSGSAGGIKIQFTGPASPTFVMYQTIYYRGTSSSIISTATAFSASQSYNPGGTTAIVAVVEGFLINGANAGTVTLQTANPAGTNACFVGKGSYIQYAQTN